MKYSVIYYDVDDETLGNCLTAGKDDWKAVANDYHSLGFAIKVYEEQPDGTHVLIYTLGIGN